MESSGLHITESLTGHCSDTLGWKQTVQVRPIQWLRKVLGGKNVQLLPFMHCWCAFKLIPPLWKTGTKSDVSIPDNPVGQLLGNPSVLLDRRMLMAALLTTVKIWKLSPCLPRVKMDK